MADTTITPLQQKQLDILTRIAVALETLSHNKSVQVSGTINTKEQK